MMNRIILIGNGFDLAHGLPTGYCDFIADYWRRIINVLEQNKGFYLNTNDKLIKINFQNSAPNNLENVQDANSLIKYIEANSGNFEYQSPYFKRINNKVNSENWVDIENEFYTLLKAKIQPGFISDPQYENPQKLNDDLNLIKDNLVSYLSRIQEEKINPELINADIRSKMYEPFSINDISVEGNKRFREFLESRWGEEVIEGQVKSFICNYPNIDFLDIWSDINFYKAHTDSFEKHFAQLFNEGRRNARYFMLPDQILFLNFNYTKTADLYLAEGSSFKVNHIHGELGNENNPVIFGYGDELDEDYKKISNLNDNGYLTNIKSIRYLETDNYRKLLQSIDSAPYQIYIMGHSCGNSDRTLLNTLFEHRNCISIKPFYHKRADGTDNYIDIIQNISRDFNDMTLMRDRVVNKGYCRPLVE